jgi:DNA-directed RNA polymerase specialized sigma24 family protein
MFGYGKERNTKLNSQYATSADYCQIFQQDMGRLYLLSFLLTANHARAEQCYVEGMENAVDGSPVFKEWARSWSKRSVIQNAIRLVFSECVQSEIRDCWHESPVSSVIDAVTRLAPLKRFVFVMSVLERYSDRECSILLNCSTQDVIDARLQALRTLGRFDSSVWRLTDSTAQCVPLFSGRRDIARKTVAELPVDVLVDAGVERVYGVPGDSLNGTTDSIRTRKGH